MERDLRRLKVDDLSPRPIHYRLEARVQPRVHLHAGGLSGVALREALVRLIVTDESSPARENSVALAVRSAPAYTAATKRNEANDGVRGFRELLDYIGALTRNTVRVATDQTSSFELLSTPTPTQPRVFEPLGTTVPRRSKALCVERVTRFLPRADLCAKGRAASV